MGRSEIEANPDGIPLGGFFFETLMACGLLSRASQADPASLSYRAGVDMYRRTRAATPAYAVITTPDNSRTTQIDVGRRWLRLNLATTAAGLGLHPVMQVTQEYPEMAGLRSEAHALLAKPGETVQLIGRLGYGPKVPPTPRWPLDTRMHRG